MDDVRAWLLGGVALLISGCSFVYTMLQNTKGDRREEIIDVIERISAVEDAHASHSERMARIEERLHHMPDKDTVHRIAINVLEVKADTKSQNETLRSLAEDVKRITKAI